MLKKLVADHFLKSLDHLESGSLDLTLPDGRKYLFKGAKPGADASMVIEDWKVPSLLAHKGDTGLAEAYRDGLWHTDDPAKVIALGIQNENAVQTYVNGQMFTQFLTSLSYKLKLNTLKGSRRNISAHYDLGNDFYSLWLDPTMTYSSAIFKKPDEDLTQAQLNKYDRIIDRMQTQSGSILEVGCGWGGFAARAAERGDYAIKGITLSDEQYNYARQRVGGRSSIVLEDYRAQNGTFDNIVSIEMFEAVGEKYWQTYFNKLGSLLKRGGRAVIQTITIEESRFEGYRTSTDFIRSFIFPGGMLPSPNRFKQEAAKAGLRVNDHFDFGRDYATTVERWMHTFDGKTAEMRALGYDDGFMRLWRFYLAGCIAGFRTGRTSVMQVELQHA
jgi:cyclopropane-fatty-acyl-phospholipid synthase